MKKSIVTLFLILLFNNIVFAQSNIDSCLTLSKALELALENNAEIKASRLDIKIKKNNIKTANRLQNPSLAAFFTYGQSGKSEPQQIGVSQPIEIAKRDARKKLAFSDLELAQQYYNFKEFSVKMEIRKTYLEFLAAKSSYKVLEKEKQMLDEVYKIAEQRVKKGISTKKELLQIEVALSQITTKLNTAKMEVQTAQIDFNKALNLTDSIVMFDIADENLDSSSDFIDLMTPNPKDKFYDFDNIKDDCLKKRFDLRVSKLEIDKAKRNLEMVKRLRIPDLELQAGYGYQTGSRTHDGYYGGGYAGVSVTNLPLLYNYSPEIENAVLELEQTELKYKSQTYAALKNLNKSYDKFITAKLNLNYYDENTLSKTDKLIELAKKTYAEGKSNTTSFLVMEESHLEIKTGYITALARYYNSWIDFLSEVNDEEFKVITENL